MVLANKQAGYDSSIPEGAEARVVETHPNGSPSMVEYWEEDRLVGRRLYEEDGALYYEVPYRDGLQHGRVYRWDWGSLTSMEPFENGLPHGTAYQWGKDRQLIGSYTMEHGTGTDLWFQACSDGPAELSEVHFIDEGQAHGWEWWINPDQRSVYEERHWRHGILHGIERSWNRQGRLRRGYPRYWVNGRKVTRRQYLHETAADPSLPLCLSEDDLPYRQFPEEIQRHLKP